ncbi:MAG TPA: Holliday junction resolvase RuvX [Candidatus Saccharimonadales bacterium]|nr:Holliday junction resolvase RuvX [Candidatus Saccharimonadales bacterium]
MKYLGLDIGKKNIGVASGEIIASELTTLRAGKDENFYQSPAKDRAFEEIGKLLRQEEADALVVGLPVDENGQDTEESKHIHQLASQLEAELNVTVHLTNETLTSFMAEDILSEQGLSGDEAKKRIDQLAASLILQQFIEENAGS